MDTPEAKQDLGGIVIPSGGGALSGDSSTPADVSASAETIRKRKTRSDAGQSRVAGAKQPSASVPVLSSAQFQMLYNPEIWGRALAAPADTMAAITGKAHWEVSAKEKENLGATGAIAAQCFAVSDPRYLALALACITILDVYGMRLAKDWADAKKAQAEEERRRKDIHKEPLR